MDFHEKWRNLMASLDDKSPQIKIVVGVVGLIGAGVAAAFAATKIKDDVVDEKKDFENIKRLRESKREPREVVSNGELEGVVNPENIDKDICDCYSDKDYAKDVINTTLRFSWKLIKRFGIPIVMGVASTLLIFNGANVMSNRLAGTVEALATVTSAYGNYRQGVIDRYGEKVDEELRLGIKEETITQEEVVTDENGKEKVVKKKMKAKVANGDPNLTSPYAFYVDEKCTEYVKDIVQMEMYADAQQTLLNQDLKRGHRKWVTLADIYDIFGRPQSEYTRDSLVVGIVYDENKNPDGDNYVDFRAQRVFYMDENGRYKAKLLIDPNVEGSIYDKLPKALRYSDGCTV